MSKEIGDLPLRGNLATGEIERLDGKGLLKSAPDPAVLKIAQAHAKNLDALEDARRACNYTQKALAAAFSKSSKAPFVKVAGRFANYSWRLKDLGEQLVLVKE